MAKDILIVIQFKSKVLSQAGFSYDDFTNNTYPVVVFTLLLASIVLTELLNAITVLLYKPSEEIHLSQFARILMVVLTPLLPGITLFAEKKLKSNMIKECSDCSDPKMPSSELQKKLTEGKSLISSIEGLRTTLRANENFVEHFVQLAVFVIILLAEKSETRPVQTMGNIIVESSQSFVLVTMAASMLSLVRGHVNYIYSMVSHSV